MANSSVYLCEKYCRKMTQFLLKINFSALKDELISQEFFHLKKENDYLENIFSGQDKFSICFIYMTRMKFSWSKKKFNHILLWLLLWSSNETFIISFWWNSIIIKVNFLFSGRFKFFLDKWDYWDELEITNQY